MTVEVRINKNHYHLIESDMQKWLKENVGRGGWFNGETLHEHYDWGVWWCMGSGGVVLRDEVSAEKFRQWLAQLP